MAPPPLPPPPDTPWTDALTYNPADIRLLSSRYLRAQDLQRDLQRAAEAGQAHHTRAPPRNAMKLERLSRHGLNVILVFLYVSSAITLCCGVFLSAWEYALFNSDGSLYFDYQLALAIVSVDGILRSLGSALLFFLVVVFPQRIARDAWFSYRKFGTLPSPEALLTAIFIIFLSITPAYSIWGLVDYWLVFQQNLLTSYGSGLLLTFNIISVTDDYSVAAQTVQMVTTCINLSLIFLFWGGLAFWQGHRADYESVANASAAAEKRGGENDESGDAGEAMFEVVGADSFVIVLKAHFWRARRFVNRQLDAVQRTMLDLPLSFAVQLFVYFAMSLGLVLGFRFQPSQVPLVGILSVIRVCAANPSDYAPGILVNETIVDSDGNILRVYLINITPSYHDNATSLCAPGGSEENQVFWRAISVTAMFISEVLLLRHVFLLAQQSRKRLAALPYAKTRSFQLNFNFFQYNSFQVWLTVFITSIIQLCVAPEFYWIIYRADVSTYISITSNLSSDLNFSLYNDPLFAVGVTPSTQSWGPFFVMLCTWLMLMAYAYLPPDANQGFLGWLTPLPPRKKTNKRHAASRVAYFATEAEVQVAFASLLVNQSLEGNGPRHNEDRTAKHKGRNQHHPSSGTASRVLQKAMSVMGMELLPEYSHSPLCTQIDSGVFCLETEILMYHFMYCSYDAPALRDDGSRLSWQDKVGLIQDKRFRLVAHLENAQTDTHCLVCVSQDRIVVAFRGTVSVENMKTDLNSSNFEHPLARDVVPVLDDERDIVAANAARRPPFCHKGFVLAFNSVREELLEHIKRLLAEVPTRVVFVTGHSLGGGLAVVASLDIAISLKLPPAQIAVTTFGAPKVGTFSFVRRVARVVPSVRRIAMAGDIITKLPVGSPLDDLFLGGWYHVGTEVLFDVSGNMVLNPTYTERIMLQRGAASTSHHLRLAYATALMAWAVRSHQDEVQFDWWVLVVNNWWARAGKRLATIAPGVRERLLADMMRSGVVYVLDGKTKVRDFGVTTGEETESSAVVLWAEMRLMEGLQSAKHRGDDVAFDEIAQQLYALRQAASAVHAEGAAGREPEQRSEEELMQSLHDALLAGDLERFDGLLKSLDEMTVRDLAMV